MLEFMIEEMLEIEGKWNNPKRVDWNGIEGRRGKQRGFRVLDF